MDKNDLLNRRAFMGAAVGLAATTQHAQQGVGWQKRNVQWLESASNRIEELKRRSTARNTARERIFMRVSDGAVVLNYGSSDKPN